MIAFTAGVCFQLICSHALILVAGGPSVRGSTQNWEPGKQPLSPGWGAPGEWKGDILKGGRPSSGAGARGPGPVPVVVRVRNPCKGQHVGKSWGRGSVTLELGTREPTEAGVAQQVPLRVLDRLLKVKAEGPPAWAVGLSPRGRSGGSAPHTGSCRAWCQSDQGRKAQAAGPVQGRRFIAAGKSQSPWMKSPQTSFVCRIHQDRVTGTFPRMSRQGQAVPETRTPSVGTPHRLERSARLPWGWRLWRKRGCCRCLWRVWLTGRGC